MVVWSWRATTCLTVWNSCARINPSTKCKNHVGKSARRVVVFGGDGRVQLANPHLFEIWNLPEDAFADGLRLSDVLDQMGSRLAADGRDWATRKQAMADAVMSRRTATGKVKLINTSVLAYANVALPNGAVLVSYTDVTDADRVEEALREPRPGVGRNRSHETESSPMSRTRCVPR